MHLLLDSFWRAAAYCLHPQVIALSFLPLVLMGGLSFGLGYFFWDPAVTAVAVWLETHELVHGVLGWLDRVGLAALRTVFAPLLVLVLVTPGMVLLCLLLVAALMTPAMAELVGQRRFAQMELKRGGSLALSVLGALGATLLAAFALLLSMPLWLVPPLVLILPPLIWGWLAYRLFAFVALARHASAQERKTVLMRHRGTLLAMGVFSGFLGAAPSLLWASGAMFIALAPLLVPVAVWIYTLVFAFASLWFVHYTLAALQALRALQPPDGQPAPESAGGAALPGDDPVPQLPPSAP